MSIQIVSTESFRKAFRSFRESEQKAIDNALDKFIKEPLNRSSNFEKLPFIDPKLRSIRVNKEMRIILAEMEDVFFLLYVDHHIPAYKWGEKKRIDRHIITGEIQIYTDPIDIVEVSSELQKSDEVKPIFSQCSVEQLKIIGVPPGWIDRLKIVNNEEDYFKLWDYLPSETINDLEAIRNGFDIRNLVLQKQNEENKLPIEKQIEKQAGFEFITEDESLAEALKKDISVFRFYLHPTQKYLVDNKFKGPVKLTGTAGTGKTVAAIHKAKKLAEELTGREKPVFFTTFTKYLIKNIRSLFEELNIPEERLVISNLHHFAVEYSKKLELLSGNPIIIETDDQKLSMWDKFCTTYFIKDYSAKFLLDEYVHIIQGKHINSEDEYLIVARTGQGESLSRSKRSDIWKIFTQFEAFQLSQNTFSFEDICFMLNKYLDRWPELKPFSHVICDEVQDFSNLELRLLRSLVPEGRNDMFLTGDPFQNIYQKQISFSQSNIYITGRSFRLRKNYRTTDEIQKLAFSAITNFQFSDFDDRIATLLPCESLIIGESPEFKMFKNDEQEFQFLADYIHENFGRVGLHEICFATRVKNKREELKNFLTAQKFTCINLEEVTDLRDTEGRIVLSTLHGLKGLEFKNLVIFSLSKNNFPFIPRGFSGFSDSKKIDYLKSEHALLYVSFSRAISTLIITGVGEKLSFEKTGN